MIASSNELKTNNFLQIPIEDIILHKNYSGNKRRRGRQLITDDIALLRLSEMAEINQGN
jgi:hypothetical protein